MAEDKARNRVESSDSARECNAVFRPQGPAVARMGFFNGLLRPDECMHFRINAYLIEKRFIRQRSEQLALKYWSKIDILSRLIVKSDMNPIGSDNLERNDSVNWMIHSIQTCCTPNLKIRNEAGVTIGFPGARASCPRRLIRAVLARSLSI